MMHKIKMKISGKAPNNLFVIGNGFDIWQGSDTSYKSFARFYNQNKFRFAQELGLKNVLLLSDKEKSGHEITCFDLFYGVISNAGCELNEEDTFWSTFEEALGDLDIDLINLYYGNDDGDMDDLCSDIDFAYRLIRKCFVEWVKSVNVTNAEASYRFKNSYFIDFNYTDTLQKRFGVSNKRIYYPHGNAFGKDGIVFGHDNCERPPVMLSPIFGNRLFGKTQLQMLLYLTDKKVRLHIADMLLTMFEYGIRWEEIKNVYILGHSMGKVDIKYFERLAKETAFTATWHVTCFRPEDAARKEELLKRLRVQKFQIYNTIDEAIAKFKVL